MKLGLGLYRHMLTPENFAFARQAGATHVVAHLVDYFRGGGHVGPDDQPTGTDWGWVCSICLADMNDVGSNSCIWPAIREC